MNILANEYAQYAEQVLPENAGEIQKQETKRAFYAGASSVFYKLIKESVDQEAGMSVMKSINTELQGFATDVIEGRQ